MNSPEQDTAQRQQLWQQMVAEGPQSFAGRADELCESVLRVWGFSEYVQQAMVRDPMLLPSLLADDLLQRPLAEGEMDRRLVDALSEPADEAALHRGLRRFRRDMMVRIIWRDLLNLAPLEETLHDLSDLADCCITRALDWLQQQAVQRLGTPRDADGQPQRMLVLAMGKLGARELNLSSDIDLIFVHAGAGQTDGPRALSNEQFFTQLARALIKALGSLTADGFVFRVDTRLRPFGDAGPLVPGIGFMEEYYHGQAREWERYAMVKARVVCGDEALRDELMQVLRPFVFRRYLDFGAVESIRDMKQMINSELKHKRLQRNVKLGPGGIREIEFIGQAFQLIRGGREPALQVRPILEVLQVLGDKQLLPDYQVDQLSGAYRFLRLTENRVQAWRDEQTHLLPDDEAGRARIAASMGFADWAAFSAELEQHRARVQSYFDQLFAAPHQDEGQQSSPLGMVWQLAVDDEQAVHRLELAGYADGAAALEQLKRFRDASPLRYMGGRGRDQLDRLMPMLLEKVGSGAHAVRTLERLLRFLEAVARRTAYLALLAENPLVLSQWVQLFEESAWIADLLSRVPALLDELLDPRRLYSPLRREQLDQELDDALSAIDADDEERQMDCLRHFVQSNMLRVAAADITGRIPLNIVSDYLSDIAEAVTQEVHDQAWRRLSARHGRPGGIVGEGSGFAVIGYGKLGGLELGYGSDLDLVFLHGSEGFSAMTDGAKPLANDVFYARMGQRMIHLFSTRTGSGQLYEIDMRLRPNGKSGLLVSSLAAFEKYQLNEAWTWELQALIRARAIAGDEVVCERFAQIRRQVLCRPRDAEALRVEVREMREKMRASMDKSDDRLFDLKQGVGGIADIEFMVQFAILRWAGEFPDLVDWSDNIRLLDGLARHSLLPGDAAQQLDAAYRALRALGHRCALQLQPALVPQQQVASHRQAVQAIWQDMMLDG